MNNKNKSAITGWNCSITGFGYFLSRPKLWLGPIFATLICWIFLFLIFLIVTYFAWPSSDLGWTKYSLKILQALGLASMAALFLWAFIIPSFLNWAFEKMIQKIFLSKGENIAKIPWFSGFASGFYVVGKTIFWRILWLMIAFFFAFFSGVLGLLISQIALGHIALLDACDLSLNVRAFSARDRYLLLKKNTLGILSGGLISGIFSAILIPTVIGWLFWLPGVYAGCALWTRFWELDK